MCCAFFILPHCRCYEFFSVTHETVIIRSQINNIANTVEVSSCLVPYSVYSSLVCIPNDSLSDPLYPIMLKPFRAVHSSVVYRPECAHFWLHLFNTQQIVLNCALIFALRENCKNVFRFNSKTYILRQTFVMKYH